MLASSFLRIYRFAHGRRRLLALLPGFDSAVSGVWLISAPYFQAKAWFAALSLRRSPLARKRRVFPDDISAAYRHTRAIFAIQTFRLCFSQ